MTPRLASELNIIDLTSTNSDDEQQISKQGAFIGHRSIDITFSSASSSDATECPSKPLNNDNSKVVAHKLHTHIYETPFLSASGERTLLPTTMDRQSNLTDTCIEHRHRSSNIKVVIPSRASTLAKRECSRFD